MAATSGFAGTLERVGPVAGDAGGLVLLASWMLGTTAAPVPGIVRALLSLAAMVLVGMSLLGYQLRQADHPRAWLGWGALATALLGFAGSPFMLSAGIALFGLSVVVTRVHPRVPGLLMLAGGTVLYVVSAFPPSGGFGDDPASTAVRALTAVGLVLVAGALADLDARLLAQEHPAH